MRVPKGGGALFEESKTTEMLINHRWSAVVTRFHHILFLLANQRQDHHDLEVMQQFRERVTRRRDGSEELF